MPARGSEMAISLRSGKSSPQGNRASSEGAATPRRRHETSASPHADCHEIFPALSIDAPKHLLHRRVRSLKGTGYAGESEGTEREEIGAAVEIVCAQRVQSTRPRGPPRCETWPAQP